MGMHTPVALRQAIEAVLLDQLGAAEPPWEVSRMSWRLFPGKDSRKVENLSFAVGVNKTKPYARTTAGAVRAHSEVIVKFTVRLRGDSHVASEDDAMAYELQIHDLLTDQMPVPLIVDLIERDLVADGDVFLGTFTCTANHTYEP